MLFLTVRSVQTAMRDKCCDSGAELDQYPDISPISHDAQISSFLEGRSKLPPFLKVQPHSEGDGYN
jgi:hypothetical protein